MDLFLLVASRAEEMRPVSAVTGCLISLMKSGPAREELEPQLNLVRRHADRSQTDQHDRRSHESLPMHTSFQLTGTSF